MYKRKIDNVFQLWLDDASHKPLVVKGVRQCGKTSSVVDFARKHFKNVVYLDFREHPDYKKFFTPNLEVDAIILRITAAMPSVEIEPGETCFIFDEIQDCPRVEAALHDRFRELLHQYIVVGGMPEVVSTFLEERQIGKVLTVQRRIVEGYKSDMVKYAAPVDKARIRECFEPIPAQLAREYKKFSYNVVRPGGRGRDYADSLQWIEDAGIIRRCYNTEITELPLDGHRIQSEFKVYMADIGLLVAMLEEGTQSSILQGDLLTYHGAIKENLVADILGKMGRKLYYFHKDTGLELDFLLRYKGRCTPVECKATTGNAKSLNTVLKHPEKYNVTSALKLGDYNIGCKDSLLTLPMYMAFLLTDV